MKKKKKKNFDVCFFKRIVMPSAMLMIPSIACCKTYLLRFGKRKDVLCQEGIMLLRYGEVPFCYLLMHKKFIYLP